MARSSNKKQHAARITVRAWRPWLAGGAGVGLMVTGVLWGGSWLLDPDTLPIRSVQVEGRLRYLDAEGLKRVVAPHASGGFFTVDIGAVHAAVARRPWVEKATVRRVWPDTLRIHVAEHKPLARWGEEGLVSQRGRWFAASHAELDSQLPVLYGPDGFQRTMARRYQELNQLFASIGRKVVELRVSERRAWRLKLDSGLEIRVGRVDIERRLRRFLRVYSDVSARGDGEMATADLRYTNGLAVRWHAAEPDAGGI